MARQVRRLTAADVKSAGVGMHADGAGLYLRVTNGPDGAIYRSWIYRYAVAQTVVRKNGKARQRERQMGLGPCDASTIATATASLALARRLTAKAYEDRRLGNDPINKRAAARKVIILTPATKTFDRAADDYIAQFERGWKSEQHRAQWVQSLAKYVSPYIGSKPVDEITTDDVVLILTKIWHRIPETASRIRGRIETVLDFAGMNGSNPARWQGHLEHKFPRLGKKRAGHYAALPYSKAAEFVTKLRADPSPTARALEFIALTATRRSEVLGIPGDRKNPGMTWGEVNLDAATWTVAGRRMKAGREHVVPLSAPALTILRGLERGADGDKVFAVSPEAAWRLVRQLCPGASVHGLRSTFRDWAGNLTFHSREVIEESLAHTLGAVEGAYKRVAMMLKRRKLMADWAQFLSRPYAEAEAEFRAVIEADDKAAQHARSGENVIPLSRIA
jgi:integrase